MSAGHQSLAGIVVFIHLLWILFLVFGFYFVLKRSRVAYIHAAGLLFSLMLNMGGWYCPLTYLEEYLKAQPRLLEKSFSGRIVESIVYPEIDESVIRTGQVLFVLLNGVAYAWAIGRRKKTGDRTQKTAGRRPEPETSFSPQRHEGAKDTGRTSTADGLLTIDNQQRATDHTPRK